MQETPAGQYYDSLFWKHSEELWQLIEANPGKYDELVRVNRLFIPGLEALLDGKGGTVRITSEQVDGLKAQLEWFAARESHTLQKDIQKEQQRLSLDHLVGMTMNEAWDFINSRWTPDMVVQQISPPDASVQQTSAPDPVVQQTLVPNSVVQQTSIPGVVVEQTLVPDSDGRWAYYVCNGIYLEYPASYHIQFLVGSIFFVQSTDLSEWWDPSSIIVDIWNLPVADKGIFSPSYLYTAENIMWEGIVQNGEFEGFEYISNVPNEPNDPVMILGAMLYNQENQLGVHIHVNGIPPVSEDFALIKQRYEDFQHMVESVKIQLP